LNKILSDLLIISAAVSEELSAQSEFKSTNLYSSIARQFLEKGYRVIFLSRAGSIMPFTKVLRRACPTNLGFELLSKISTENGLFSLQIDPSLQEELQSYEKNKSNLFYVPFSTVDDYLAHLEAISQLLDRVYSSDGCDFRTSVLFYLAAAVSDFYLPPHKLSEHKIQSGAGLVLELEQVPKMLPILTSTWAPRSYVVSFKLETERSLVVEKATRAIQNYGVHSVVANQLQVSPSLSLPSLSSSSLTCRLEEM
jgi:phosphopantothenate---cysteine ligase (ATP)